jgi:hypothetical protein
MSSNDMYGGLTSVGGAFHHSLDTKEISEYTCIRSKVVEGWWRRGTGRIWEVEGRRCQGCEATQDCGERDRKFAYQMKSSTSRSDFITLVASTITSRIFRFEKLVSNLIAFDVLGLPIPDISTNLPVMAWTTFAMYIDGSHLHRLLFSTQVLPTTGFRAVLTTQDTAPESIKVSTMVTILNISISGADALLTLSIAISVL